MTMCEQERYDLEVMREKWEEEQAAYDSTEAWEVRFGTAEEARGDYDHDIQKQYDLDNR